MVAPAYRIGVDVGGTNTDAVLMSGRQVVASAKAFTTADVAEGVVHSVTRLLENAGLEEGRFDAVMIGTTQFVNAFVQRSNLTPVAAIRVALPKADGIPPMSGWPEDLIEAIRPEIYMVGGGAYYTGKDYAPLDEDAVRHAAVDARSKGFEAVAISASFSPIRPDLETRAAAIVRSVMPDARITLSAQVGGIGLIERENAAIINACLGDMAAQVVGSLVRAFRNLRIEAPIFLSQNDGTLISTQTARRFPIMTCSAGPTNSIRGAAFLTGLDEAIVADIGGTTTDIGFLLRGFPRETTAANDIGGVRTNFRMPDVLSIGLGGGSLVVGEPGKLRVGPRSVGYRLQSEALVFGGATLTATDIAVRADQAAIGDPGRVADLPASLVEEALAVIHARIEAAVDQVKTSPRPMPLVLVGGGGILVSRHLKGTSEVRRPDHADVANAVGAAIALISGRVDKLYDVGSLGREAALDLAKGDAIAAAVAAGALESEVEVLEVIELPMTHMKSGSVQIKVRAVGPVAALV